MNLIDPTGHKPPEQTPGEYASVSSAEFQRQLQEERRQLAIEELLKTPDDVVQANYAAATTSRGRFLALLPAFFRAQVETGVTWLIHAAQWGLESGWGKAMPIDIETGQLSNNFFGIKGAGPLGSVTDWTRDIVDGKEVYRLQKFAAYSSVTDSILGQSKLLMDDYYAPVRECGSDAACAGLLLGARSTGGLNYSDEPEYWKLLQGVINTFTPWLPDALR